MAYYRPTLHCIIMYSMMPWECMQEIMKIKRGKHHGSSYLPLLTHQYVVFLPILGEILKYVYYHNVHLIYSTCTPVIVKHLKHPPIVVSIHGTL